MRAIRRPKSCVRPSLTITVQAHSRRSRQYCVLIRTLQLDSLLSCVSSMHTALQYSRY